MNQVEEIWETECQRIMAIRAGCTRADAELLVRGGNPSLWAAVENGRHQSKYQKAFNELVVAVSNSGLRPPSSNPGVYGGEQMALWDLTKQLFPDLYAAAFQGKPLALSNSGVPQHLLEIRDKFSDALKKVAAETKHQSATPATPVTEVRVDKSKQYRQLEVADNAQAKQAAFLDAVKRAEVELKMPYTEAWEYAARTNPELYKAAFWSNKYETALPNNQSINLPPGVKRLQDGTTLPTGPADDEELKRLGLPKGVDAKFVQLYRSFSKLEPAPELVVAMLVALISFQTQTSLDWNDAWNKAAAFLQKTFPDLEKSNAVLSQVSK